MPLRLVVGVRGTVAGHRLGALERGGGRGDPPSHEHHSRGAAGVLHPKGDDAVRGVVRDARHQRGRPGAAGGGPGGGTGGQRGGGEGGIATG